MSEPKIVSVGSRDGGAVLWVSYDDATWPACMSGSRSEFGSQQLENFPWSWCNETRSTNQHAGVSYPYRADEWAALPEAPGGESGVLADHGRNVKMERMGLTLRETASKALRDYRWQGRDSSLTEQAYCERMTDVVLAALGLDDLDAAVERAGEALRVEHGSRLDFARAALEAALTATPESEASE